MFEFLMQHQPARRAEIRLSDEFNWDEDANTEMFDRWSDRNYPDDERFDWIEV